MALSDASMPPGEVAALCAALAHPVRVQVLRLLRAVRSQPLADLRRALAETGHEMDTRTLQHHVLAMHAAGVVDLERLGARFRVHLVRDVQLKVKGV